MQNEKSLSGSIKTMLDNLNLVDRFLFDETMEYPEAYGAAVAILLQKEIPFLSRSETEKELRVSPELRSVRLDVVGMDAQGRIYHTEMQKQNTYNLLRRSRYCQAQLDVSLLEPGCIDFNLLNDVVVILVAPFDIFGFGLYRYTFNGTCQEIPELKLEDGATRIFINTHGTNHKDFPREFLDFMDYINLSTDETASRTDSERIRLIHDRVCRVRASEKAGIKYMQLWEEREWNRREARKEGLAEGLAEGRAEGHAQGHAEGRAEGLAEGRAEGLAQGESVGLAKGELRMLIQLVCRKLRKGVPPERIAEDLDENLSLIMYICAAAKECEPDYDCGKIYEILILSGSPSLTLFHT